MTILWADDEIDLLKPHIIFLNARGYDVVTACSGADAVDLVREQHFDLVFLDEHMPGISGLEALERIKAIAPQTPVVMITKSEEEEIMDQAVGRQIADYLIKPVNPHQILMSLKKLLHGSELRQESVAERYRREFSALGAGIDSCADIEGWKCLYRRLAEWQMQIGDARDASLDEMLDMQMCDADKAFSRFMCRNYLAMLEADPRTRPVMSPDIIPRRVFPLLDSGQKVCLMVIDNFRLDQWLAVKPMVAEMFAIESEELGCSILPTATQYARNAIFSGLMPAQIAKMFPQFWADEHSAESKNLNERPLLELLLGRYRRNCRLGYTKISDSAAGEKLVRNYASMSENDLNVVVVNFIDMLSHARTEQRMIRELAATEAAYRSLTASWFGHSWMLPLLRRIAASGARLVIATDHGIVRVSVPVKVVGDRSTTASLRYKGGKSLAYNPRRVFEVKHPEQFGLPAPSVSSAYIFATGRDFFVYPNNQNHYSQYYEGTFQHGGISMEEMLVPLITLTPKK
ncbi:MAG: PglZ domain-containing protein [Muribaculaceae bacterium]|nr:PglZ domain-containing protein [Muribaculaceae bacterium]